MIQMLFNRRTFVLGAVLMSALFLGAAESSEPAEIFVGFAILFIFGFFGYQKIKYDHSREEADHE